MNKREKEVLKSSLTDEQKALKELTDIYKKASEDCANKIRELSMRTDLENLQSIVYQKQYQEMLKTQIDAILNELQTESFTSVSEYLSKCYENGYIGTMYNIAGQGIPIITPIDHKQVLRALETDSKISTSLYTKMGEDSKKLKNTIRNELSRGVAQGKSWNDIANSIASGMNSPFTKAKNRTSTIARTEGHRIQMTAADDAAKEAVKKGAHLVKQWDATLDDRTRDSHAMVDGEIVEMDEAFSNGLMYPSDPKGSAAEVINCRCTCNHRAKWALDEADLDRLKERANFYGLDKSKNFDNFKSKYLTIID